MRRVFTCLTSGWQTTPFIHGGKRFSGRPGLSHFGREASKASKTTTKVFGPHSPGVARYLFSLFVFIELFLLKFIELNSLLTFLKDARERGAHEDCQSPLPGQVGPGLTV